ncbi:hypothetical protein D3C83_149450 [compost metagenome]
MPRMKLRMGTLNTCAAGWRPSPSILLRKHETPVVQGIRRITETCCDREKMKNVCARRDGRVVDGGGLENH